MTVVLTKAEEVALERLLLRPDFVLKVKPRLDAGEQLLFGQLPGQLEVVIAGDPIIKWTVTVHKLN